MRQFTVERCITLYIAIQQINRYYVTADTLDQISPRAQLDSSSFDFNLNARVHLVQQRFWSPVHCRFSLVSRLIERLTEVALAIQQSDANHANSEVRGRSQRVARQHAETTGKGRQIVIKANLHREIADLRCSSSSKSAARCGWKWVDFCVAAAHRFRRARTCACFCFRLIHICFQVYRRSKVSRVNRPLGPG